MADRTTNVFLRLVVDAYKQAANEAVTETKKIGNAVDDVNAKSSTTAKKMAAETDKATASTKNLGGSLSDLTGKAGGAAGALAIAGTAVTTLALAAKTGVDSYTDLVDRVSDLADVTGSSLEEASELVAISDALGVSTETVGTAMFRLSRTIETNKSKLSENGIEIERNRDGSVDLVATLMNVADAYRAAGAGAAGNQIVLDAFGQSGKEVIEILKQGRGELERLTQAARENGSLVTAEDKAKVEQYEEATRELADSIDELIRTGGEELVPLLTDLADAMTAIIEVGKDAPFGGVPAWARTAAENTPGVKEALFLADLLPGGDDGERATQSWTTGIGNLVDRIRDLAGSADANAILDYAEALKTLAEQAFAVDDATSEIVGDVGDLAASVREAQENGDRFATSLDVATESGLANRNAIRDLAQGVLDMAATLREQGASEEQIAGVTAAYRAELAETLTQLGFNREEVDRYLTVLGLIPSSVNTTVRLDASQAFEVLNQLRSSVWGLQGAFRRAMGLNPWAGDAAVADAMGAVEGIGRATDPATRQPERVDPDKARREADAAEREADARNAARFAYGDISLQERQAYLDSRIAQEVAYSDDWRRLMGERAQLFEDFGAGLRAVAEHQQEIEDNMFDAGAMATDRYLEVLRSRLEGLEKFSDEWQRVWERIKEVTGDQGQQLLDLIKAVEEQRLRDQAYYGAMEQRMLSNLRSIAAPPVVVHGGATYNRNFESHITTTEAEVATQANRSLRHLSYELA